MKDAGALERRLCAAIAAIAGSYLPTPTPTASPLQSQRTFPLIRIHCASADAGMVGFSTAVLESRKWQVRADTEEPTMPGIMVPGLHPHRVLFSARE